MQLYCKDGVVVAWYDDAVSVPDGAHPSAYVIDSASGLSSLGRVGDPVEGGPDTRPYRAPALDLSAYAAAKRYAVETGGVAVNGAIIATDRESQAMIGNAFAYVQASGAATVSYKSLAAALTLS